MRLTFVALGNENKSKPDRLVLTGAELYEKDEEPKRRIPQTNYKIPIPPVERVIFNKPATIILWKDGTKTVSKCSGGDTFNKETGILWCIMKKIADKGGVFEIMDKYIK